jgi:hypothetical protein
MGSDRPLIHGQACGGFMRQPSSSLKIQAVLEGIEAGPGLIQVVSAFRLYRHCKRRVDTDARRSAVVYK